MGRKRKDNPLDLPEHVYWNHGQFRYVHAGGRWEGIGTDVEAAKETGKRYNKMRADPDCEYGTMAYYLDEFIKACDKRVTIKTLSQRTADDYRQNIVPLKAFFGKMTPADVTPKSVKEYLDLGMELNRPVRANRERACMSACFSWMIVTGEGDVKINPCMRASGIKRNTEKKREVYVEDAWFNAVHARAPKMVQAMMTLVYRTLQRPEDIIGWGAWNRKTKDGEKILRNKQGKRGAIVDIALTADLEILLTDLAGEVPSITQPYLHTLKGEVYTYDGLCSMFRRIQKRVRKEVPDLAAMPTWGFYDLKGKGATDMWRSGVPIELIQLLCGHADKATTEIYIKSRWRETAQSNTSKLAN